MKASSLNIGILTFPLSKSGIVPLSNLLNIICSISKETYLITGHEGYLSFRTDKRFAIYGINHKSSTNVFMRMLNYMQTQLKMTYRLIRISNRVDVWFFFIGGESLVVPILVSKLLNRKVVLIFPGSITQSLKSKGDIFFNMASIISKINCKLASHIVLYSRDFISQWGLSSFSNKISIAHENIIDFDKFYQKKHLSEKENLIGYIGRFSSEKGIINFIESIPLLLKKRKDLKFKLIGDGHLKREVLDFLDENELLNSVELTGWIKHDDLPIYLNDFKLVILPSYTEGLPNLMLESMACGTPVLSSPVGAIPDIIKDGETGFLMKNNSPECIAKNVFRVLENSQLETIAEKSRTLVVNNFTLKVAVKNYENILDKVYSNL